MADLERRPRRACGAPLVFVPGPNGKKLPLDERSQVYRIVTDLAGAEVAEAVGQVYVSHSQTCTSPNRFSASKRG